MKSMMSALRDLFGVAGLLCLCAVTPARAIPITDFVNPADTLTVIGSTPSPCPAGFTCTPGALTYFHDITDSGFDVGLDILTGATMAIHLTDTGGSEHYQFDIGTVPQIFISKNVPGGNGSTDTITLNAASLADLAADGMISINVSSTSGSFSFADSLLTAQLTEFAPRLSNVPEPSTLLLLGVGLAGLSSRFRRRS
jgi:hypothetical protein